MASLENLEIKSVCSDSQSICMSSALQSPLLSPTRAELPTPQIQVQLTTPDLNRSTLLQVPSFHVTVEDTDGSASEGEMGPESSSRAHGSAGGEPEMPTRPKSVLSIFGRPLSRAKSALSRVSIRSTRLQNLSSKMKSRILGLANRAKKKRQDEEDRDDLASSCSSLTDPETSIHSAEIKRKLKEEYLAGSDSENEENGVATGKKRRGFQCPRVIRNKLRNCNCQLTCNYFIDPYGGIFSFWLKVACLAYLYNAVAIPLRASFKGVVYSETTTIYAWLVFDYIFDLIYILDIVLVQTHLSYISNGVLQSDVKLLCRKYFTHWSFWLDLLSLFPLDFLYFVPVLRFNSLLRLPRLLKLRSVKLFMDSFESNTKFPHVFRVIKLVCYFLYIIHIYACIFYAISAHEGFGINEWVYDGQGTRYLRCFYWATRTVATIHDLEERNPTTPIEYAAEMFGYLLGVFIIAVFIGEIRNIVEAVNPQRLKLYRQWDRLKDYMSIWKIPKKLQDRVQSWYDYALSQHLQLDEAQVLDTLPKKMKADLAIHVHLDTLCKVALFQEFERTLMRELVLKLRPVLFVPGDFICKKGEIGKEMYIVTKGRVQVLGGAENSEFLAELGPGCVFGEISLLAVGGANRRTAHVISKGFSSVFVLSKRDLHETLVHYPDAQQTLKKKAKFLLRQDKKRERLNQAQKVDPSSKAAVTSFSTAARAARERAAANKLSGEGRKDLRSTVNSNSNSNMQSESLQTIADVHEDGKDGGAVVNNTAKVFAKTASAVRMGQFMSQTSGASLVTLASLARSLPATTAPPESNRSSLAPPTTTPTASGITYSSLWPSSKDVVGASIPNLAPDN